MDAVVDPVTTTPAPDTSSAAPSTASTPVTSTAQTAVSTPAAAEGLTPLSTRKDIADFLKKADAPAPAMPDPPIAAQPGGPTAQAAADPTKAGDVAKPYAEPPKEAWPTILENARTKALAQYGITPQITPDVFQKGLGLARRINENPIAFLNELAADLANHPTYGPQLRSSAGRTLASAPAARPEPDVQVLNDKGQVVGMTYSAERQQQVNEWDWSQREAKLRETIDPLLKDREQRLQADQVAQFQREVNTNAESELSRVSQILDGREKELGPKVAELMNQGVNHIDAALMVRKQFIVPTQAKAAEAAVLDTQLKKVAGNTVSGSGSVTPKTKLHPGMSQKELAAALRELDQASA